MLPLFPPRSSSKCSANPSEYLPNLTTSHCLICYHPGPSCHWLLLDLLQKPPSWCPCFHLVPYTTCLTSAKVFLYERVTSCPNPSRSSHLSWRKGHSPTMAHKALQALTYPHCTANRISSHYLCWHPHSSHPPPLPSTGPTHRVGWTGSLCLGASADGLHGFFTLALHKELERSSPMRHEAHCSNQSPRYGAEVPT